MWPLADMRVQMFLNDDGGAHVGCVSRRSERISGAMSASLIGRFGSSAFRRSTSTVPMSSRARASLRNRHQGPSIMGFENEVNNLLVGLTDSFILRDMSAFGP